MEQTEKQKIKDSFIKTLNFRHACKAFDSNKKISEDDLNFILEAGRLSPSSFGLEPWKFVVIENHKLLDKLLPVVWGGTGKFGFASHIVLLLAKTAHFTHHTSQYVESMFRDTHQFPEDMIEFRKSLVKGHQLEHFDFLKDEQQLTQWACRQVYIALSQMLIASAMLKIDSCPIEGFTVKKVSEVIEKEMNINPKQYFPACFVAFGYRVNEPREKTRLPHQSIVERF